LNLEKNKTKPETVLDLILKSMNEILNYELAVILKLKDKNKLVVEKADGPLANTQFNTFQIDLNQRKDLAEIISRESPFLFSETLPHIDTYDEILDLPGNHSCLVAPLYFQNQAIGILTLDHRACGMFSPSIIRFVGVISKLIAIILTQNDSSLLLMSQKNDLTRERNFLLRHENDVFSKMIGDSHAWQLVIENIRTVAASDLPVLIQGETGTGKEMAARMIHDLSTRADKPFITLNCSALNSGLAESELFGHEKGAFTSAVIQRKGRFELAEGGTLFLDEIGDLPAEIQPKLLRALQEGTYERVGGEKTLFSDVRIIAASNKNLREEVTRGSFREDLFYRLGVFPIFLPPLRQREGDIILLANTFISEINRKEPNRDYSLTNESVECLLTYYWPGNVRELQNVIRRSALVAGKGKIKPAHLALKEASLGMKEVKVNKLENSKTGPILISSVETENFPEMDTIIKEHIQKALLICHGRIYNENGAAQLLGIKPTTLQSKMKKLGIKRKNWKK
jgi:transcriptional regulator with GAF, ATPase, and Fis domain